MAARKQRERELERLGSQYILQEYTLNNLTSFH
jgi:hypothetical protein